MYGIWALSKSDYRLLNSLISINLSFLLNRSFAKTYDSLHFDLFSERCLLLFCMISMLF